MIRRQGSCIFLILDPRTAAFPQSGFKNSLLADSVPVKQDPMVFQVEVRD